VYLDETNFMPKKHTCKSFAKKHHNQTLEKDGIRAKTMSAVVTISSETGLLDYMIAEGAFDTDRFLLFLAQMKNTIGSNRKVAVFLDNLQVHHTKLVAAKIAEYGWVTVFNAAYSSEVHCIETYFAQVKKNYRK